MLYRKSALRHGAQQLLARLATQEKTALTQNSFKRYQGHAVLGQPCNRSQVLFLARLKSTDKKACVYEDHSASCLDAPSTLERNAALE